MMPLSTEPSAIPPAMAPDQMPMARPRCFSSRNMFRTRPMVEGIRVAPPIPSSARAAMSISGLVA